MQFRAFESEIEVNGQTVFAVVDGFSSIKTLAHKHLRAAGIGEPARDGTVTIDPHGWYSHDLWLGAFEGISREIGDAVLYQIGIAIPRNAKFPPWVKDIHSAIKSVDVAYHMNHRKNGREMFDPATGAMTEGIGHYGYEAVAGRNRIVSVCENPYPCEFDRGILTAMAKRFQPFAVVDHDATRPCRKKGSDRSCTYVVKW